MKGRYFLPGSILLFLLHKQNPDVTWERGKEKKKEQKVKLWLFLQESGLAQPSCRARSPGWSPEGVAGSGAGRGPASHPELRQRSACQAPSPLNPPGLAGAGLPWSWGPRKDPRTQGRREGTPRRQLSSRGSGELAGGGVVPPWPAGGVRGRCCYFGSRPGALRFQPLHFQSCPRALFGGENAGSSHRRFARKGKAEDGS